MNGEVVHTLLSLLNQRVAENFPGQVFSLAIDLFQGLVNRHCTNGHRAVAQNPFAGFMNMLASGQVHYRVATPTNGPGHFLDFFTD